MCSSSVYSGIEGLHYRIEVEGDEGLLADVGVALTDGVDGGFF